MTKARLMRLLLNGSVLTLALAPAPTPRWTEAKANEWYAKQPWLVGGNYIPATAINELEMWQADTFDPTTIDKELGWAEGLGMNTMRVFLHDLLWQQDAGRLPRSGSISSSTIAAQAPHPADVRAVRFVLGSVSELGQAARAEARRAQLGLDAEPGREGAAGPDAVSAARGVRARAWSARSRKDPRVLAWDMWNEPDNTNGGSYGELEPTNKVELVLALLPQVFAWARAAGAEQPLTSRRLEGRLVVATTS